MSGFPGNAAMNMCKQMGITPDELDSMQPPAPSPAPDAQPSLTCKSTVETIEGEAIAAEGWWHPKGDSAADAADGVEVKAPEKLATEKASEYVETVPFETFALSDEGKKVVLYFGLPGAKEKLGKDAVSAAFRTQALEVTARVGSKQYRFHESTIYEHIIPAKGKVRVKADHVVVTMFKVVAQCPWNEISVNRKAVGPVRASPPDHGRPTVVTASGEAK